MIKSTLKNGKQAFTLVELLVVIVILLIILAIAVPSIIGIVKSASKNAFESDAKLVLKAVDYKKLEDNSFDITSVNKNNIANYLGISNENYTSVNIVMIDNVPVVSIIGSGKWDGFIACGTFQNMKVVESAIDCSDDTVAPVITLLGDNPVNIFVDEAYTDAGATAFDNIAGDISNNIIVIGSVNPSIPGTYTINYSVMDAAGNTDEKIRTINVIDNVKPIITFNPTGASTYAQNRNTVINASDVGGLITNSLKYIWTTSMIEPSLDAFSSVFTNNQVISTPIGASGSYYLWATATDITGNIEVVRSDAFNLDNETPVITLIGDNAITINKGTTYIDDGTIVTDNIDPTVNVNVTGTVNPSTIGTYIITYNATDSSGNIAIPVTRTVNVVDVLAPLITILGSNPVIMEVGTVYSDEGATAIDDVDGDVTSRIVKTGTVNPNVLGTYTITYTVEDIASNQSIATRTINVVDRTIPTVIYNPNGNSTYAKTRSTTVTVNDNVSINTDSLKYLWNTSTTAPSEVSFTTAFTNGGTINTPAGLTGGYYLWILAKDMSGNTTIVKSNVFNLDNTKPVITLNGSATATMGAGSAYSDAGATAIDNINGTITSSIITTSNVNPSIGGTYTVTYNVSDSSGNAAATVTRTVIVKSCSEGTITYNATYGYVCVKNASSSSSCNSCTYTTSTYGQSCSNCGSSCNTCTYLVTTSPSSTSASSSRSCSDGSTYVASVDRCRIYTSDRVYTCSSGSVSGTQCITSATPYCTNSYYSISGSVCRRTVSCSKCNGQGLTCMNTYCGTGGYENGNWSCGATTCTATMSIHYSCSSGTLSGTNCILGNATVSCPSGWAMSSADNCYQNTVTPTTTYSCSSGSLYGASCYSCSSGQLTINYYAGTVSCLSTTTGPNCTDCGSSCNSCTYNTTVTGSNCSACGSTTSYYCPSGWSSYSGSGSSLTCYKVAQ